MGKPINEAGNRYGRLTVIERAGTAKKGGVTWLCRCDCDTQTIVGGGNLRIGNTKSCGCLQRELLSQRRSLPSGEAAFNCLYSLMQIRAEKSKLEWTLTKDQMRTLTKQNCYYCGAEPQQVSKQPSYNGAYIYNGLDRINSSGGYTMDNVVPCCKTCNYAKRIMSIKQFLEWIHRVYIHSIITNKGLSHVL